MERITTILLPLLTTVTISFGQITTTKVIPKIDQTDNIHYDSTQNFLGKEVNKYLGQELYLNLSAFPFKKYGYEGFYTDPVNTSLEIGRRGYDDLNGKYFKVLEISKHPNKYSINVKTFYLKLEEKTSKDIVYFEYDIEFEHNFPFIVVGFFEKQKLLALGKEFVFSDEFLQTSTDIETGKVIITKTGQVWKCVDLTIDEEYYDISFVVQNSLGEKVTAPRESVYSKWGKGRVYLKSDADNYRKKFGTDIFDKILQGKATIGMTKEMCKLSWGEPISTSDIITAGKKTEQWVYSDNYLYFDNGILIYINVSK